ncbi:hypothetical protein [Planifilum fimeticola]
MAILVIGMVAILSSCESGQSLSKEMGAESLPKRMEGEVGGNVREPVREGDWIVTEKGKRRWIRRVALGETVQVGPMRLKLVSLEFHRWTNLSPENRRRLSNGACTGEEVYLLNLFYKVEGGGEEKLRWMPVERLKLFSGEAVDVAERDLNASELEFEGRTEWGKELYLPLCRPVEGVNSLSVTTGILYTSKGKIISQRREFTFPLDVKRKEEDGKSDPGALN